MYKKVPHPPRKPKEEKPTIIRNYPTLTLTEKDLEEELHISKPTVTNLVHQPGFPAFQFGGRILISRKGL